MTPPGTVYYECVGEALGKGKETPREDAWFLGSLEYVGKRDRMVRNRYKGLGGPTVLNVLGDLTGHRLYCAQAEGGVSGDGRRPEVSPGSDAREAGGEGAGTRRRRPKFSRGACLHHHHCTTGGVYYYYSVDGGRGGEGGGAGGVAFPFRTGNHRSVRPCVRASLRAYVRTFAMALLGPTLGWGVPLLPAPGVRTFH